MEESTWMMHATMLTAVPAAVYLSPTTLSIVSELQRRRSDTTPAFFTTDAGPHVKVLASAEHAETVKDWLSRLPGVREVVICSPGPAAVLVPQALDGAPL
jgi:diphosphomevalonate decarboxylase